MKKLTIYILAVILLLSCLFIGCNCAGYDYIDTNYHFDRAIIKMPDGTTKEINLKTWTDARRTEIFIVTDQDGTRYMISSHNCILIEDN